MVVITRSPRRCMGNVIPAKAGIQEHSGTWQLTTATNLDSGLRQNDEGRMVQIITRNFCRKRSSIHSVPLWRIPLFQRRLEPRQVSQLQSFGFRTVFLSVFPSSEGLTALPMYIWKLQNDSCFSCLSSGRPSPDPQPRLPASAPVVIITRSPRRCIRSAGPNQDRDHAINHRFQTPR